MVDATRDQVWAVLRDPVLVARLTPLVRSITDDGAGHWRWRLGGVDVLGFSLAPAFTVQMDFTAKKRIDITPASPPGRPERTSVTGWYVLAKPPRGQRGIELSTSMEIATDLPLPGVARSAVELSMKRVIDGMGAVFAKNLLAHLAQG